MASSSSSAPFTNGPSMASPTSETELDKMIDVTADVFATLRVTDEDVGEHASLQDDASNYDDVDSNFCLYDFDYDRDADGPAPRWPAPAPLRLRTPAEYGDIAATSPYDEQFGDEVTGSSDTIAARRGLPDLCIEIPAADAAIDDDDDQASARPAALPKSQHHRRVRAERGSSGPVPTAARDAALHGLLRRMDQQTLDLRDAVARWERDIARETIEVELEMELERKLERELAEGDELDLRSGDHDRDDDDDDGHMPRICTRQGAKRMPKSLASLVLKAWGRASKHGDREDGTRAPASSPARDDN